MDTNSSTKSISETRGRKRLRVILSGLGAVLVILSLASFWFLRDRAGSHPRPGADPLPSRTSTLQVTQSPAQSTNSPADPQIDLTADDLKKAQIHTARVVSQATGSTLRVPGIVKADEYRQVHVTPIADGIVRRVPVVLGSRVRSGQPLAVIFSSELAEAETQYLSLRAKLNAEHKKLVRTQNLIQLGAASQQEGEEVAATHASHEAHVRAALERLKLLGATEKQIAALTEAEQVDSIVTVPAPIDGIVLARMANVGLVAAKGQELFTIADLSRVWVMASLNEKDFAAVRVGSPAQISTTAYQGRLWKGRVAYIDPQVDPNSRTAQARIEIANPGESLRFQMFVDVEFATSGAVGAAVPEAAVQAIGDRQFVFLPVKGSEGSFTMRSVRLGPAKSGYYAVLGGLKASDEVVISGSFILKAEGLRQHPELQ